MSVRHVLAATAVTVVVGGLIAIPGNAVAEPCGGGLFHCETNRCASAQFYIDYNPTTDHFSDPHGSRLEEGEQGNIRDEPYRRYGPRGVRAMHAGAHGFYSRTCFP